MQAYEPGCRRSGPVGSAEILGQATRGLRSAQPSYERADARQDLSRRTSLSPPLVKAVQSRAVALIWRLVGTFEP